MCAWPGPARGKRICLEDVPRDRGRDAEDELCRSNAMPCKYVYAKVACSTSGKPLMYHGDVRPSFGCRGQRAYHQRDTRTGQQYVRLELSTDSSNSLRNPEQVPPAQISAEIKTQDAVLQSGQ